MNILIINEKLIDGGAEVYALNLYNLLNENGYNTYLLCFDNDFLNNINQIKKNKKNIFNINVKSKISKIILNPVIYLKIRKLLKKIKPDKIIVNNIFSSPITQITALKGYECYQVIHDYSIICPKSTCLKDNYILCDGYKKSKCIKECKYHNSRISLKIKLCLTKIMEKLRKKYIKKLISPSECLNDFLLKNKYDSICINNPINHTEPIKQEWRNTTVKKYIYIGAISERKGIFKFIDAFNKFSENNQVKLEMIGKTNSNEDNLKLKNILKENNKIIYLGFMNHENIMKKLEQADFIIVPSLWMENYPTTVLEGMMSKTFVLGSKVGGIPEMLNGRGFLFNILDENNIIDVLNQSYKIEEEEYKTIIEKAYKYVNENNSFEKYLKKIEVEVLR